MSFSARCVGIGAGLLLAATAVGAEGKPDSGSDSKRGFLVPKETCSPNKRYAVTVPIYEFDNPSGSRTPAVHAGNDIVLTASEKTVAEMKCDPAYDRALNHHGTGSARWSKDSSLLLWLVPGKWFPDALVLVKIEKDRAQWQLDLMKTSQEAILTRTLKAAPEKYAAAKKANQGSGSAYPDGFSVEVTTSGEEGKTVSLPLAVHVHLTANVKDMEDFPANLDSHLEAVVTEDGKYTVKDFGLEKRKKPKE